MMKGNLVKYFIIFIILYHFYYFFSIFTLFILFIFFHTDISFSACKTIHILPFFIFIIFFSEPNRMKLFDECNSKHISTARIFLIPALRDVSKSICIKRASVHLSALKNISRSQIHNVGLIGTKFGTLTN